MWSDAVVAVGLVSVGTLVGMALGALLCRGRTRQEAAVLMEMGVRLGVDSERLARMREERDFAERLAVTAAALWGEEDAEVKGAAKVAGVKAAGANRQGEDDDWGG